MEMDIRGVGVFIVGMGTGMVIWDSVCWICADIRASISEWVVLTRRHTPQVLSY